jgi:hypothetical protein
MKTLPLLAAVTACLVLGLLPHGAGAATKTPNSPWGAIAYNSKTGAFGYAIDLPSRRAAETEAGNQCGADCDVVHSFRDSCAAIARHGSRYAWQSGASRQIAEAKARSQCGNEACTIAVWGCTSQAKTAPSRK